MVEEFQRITLLIHQFSSNGSFSVDLHHVDRRPGVKTIDRLIYFMKFHRGSPDHRHNDKDNFHIETDLDDIPTNHVIRVKFDFKGCKDREMPWKAMRNIATNGIIWSGCTYVYFVCKDSDDDVYFIRKDLLDCEEIGSKSFHELLSEIWDLQKLPSLSVTASRLGLLCSNTCSGLFTTGHVNIIVEKDVERAYDGITHVLTDGSGFISLDLTRTFPSYVIQGAQDSTISDNSVAAVYQVRIFSVSHGLFKGTLVVDKSLPTNTIILRESMRKVAATKYHENQIFPNNLLIIDIVNTSRVSKSFHGKLNRHLVLLLRELGVPTEVFENLCM